MYRKFIDVVAMLLLFTGGAHAATYEINIHPMGPSRGNERFNCSDGQACVGPDMVVNDQILRTEATVMPGGVSIQFYQSGMLVPVQVTGMAGGDNTFVVPAEAFETGSTVRKNITVTSPDVANPPSYADNPGARRLTGRAKAVDIDASIRRVAP